MRARRAVADSRAVAESFLRFLKCSQFVFINAVSLLLNINNRILTRVVFLKLALQFIEIELLSTFCYLLER